MKTRITLVNPGYPSGAPESLFVPLGIGYLAAVLEKNQYEVDVIDCQVLRLTHSQLEAEFNRRHPDVVGVTSATLTYKPALDILKTAREVLPNCLNIIGGPHVTVLDKQTLEEAPQVDAIVRGEGEETILELAKLASESKLKKINSVSGLTFRKDGQPTRTSDRPFIENLDDLPHPGYKYFPLDKYKILGKMYLPIITSRGCPFQCTFCLASKMCGKSFRTRSPKNAVDELQWLKDEHGADLIAFYDDTFTYDQQRASEICEEIRRRHLNLPWDCRTRVDRISPEILAKMEAANCRLIHFGVESGSQEMLNAMKKGTTVEQNAKGIKIAKDAGIAVAISVVVGYPGETENMLRATFNFIRKTSPDYVYVCRAIPYPGTELLDRLNELGWKVSVEWNQYDEQSRVFENPILPPQKIDEMQRKFYNSFFSPAYFLRKSMRGDLYGQVMARSALNHLLWRMRLPGWVSASFRKVAPMKRTQRETEK